MANAWHSSINPKILTSSKHTSNLWYKKIATILTNLSIFSISVTLWTNSTIPTLKVSPKISTNRSTVVFYLENINLASKLPKMHIGSTLTTIKYFIFLPRFVGL